MAIPSVTDLDKNECLTHLKNLIRINTTNPPGNEIKAVRYLSQIFDKEKIPYQIVEPKPGRASIIARVKGDGSKKPILLASHLDVVPHERKFWSCDPFEAVTKNESIYGRGAVDMKNVTAMELITFLKLKRSGIKSKRDIILAAVADEEAGCTYGSSWIIKNCPELIAAEYGLNEVGGFTVWIDDIPFYPIGVAEKGFAWFDIIASGDPGHGSMPHKNQAVGKLGKAAALLAKNDLPYQKTKVVRDFILGLSAPLALPKKIILRRMLDKGLHQLVIENLLPDKNKAKNFWNMLRNTVSPTMLEAGTKVNVIPANAKLTVDGRILPESSVDEFLEQVKAKIGPGYEFEVHQAQEPNQLPYPNEFYDLLCDSLTKHHPGCHPLPFLIPGFSDSNNYNQIGIKVYGFAPVKLPKDIDYGALYHGHDERIPIASMHFATEVMWDVVTRWVF